MVIYIAIASAANWSGGDGCHQERWNVTRVHVCYVWVRKCLSMLCKVMRRSIRLSSSELKTKSMHLGNGEVLISVVAVFHTLYVY
jgi:hypothetical protein